VGAEAARITKFNPKKYEKLAIKYDEVFPTIKDWLANCDHIVGHNILGFDVYLIQEYYKKMNEPFMHLLEKFIDTNCIAKGIKMGIPYKPEENFVEYQYRLYNKRQRGVKTNLKVLIKEYNISCDESKLHDALYDLEQNAKVWDKLKYQLEF
jgi:DNA polymerase III epsilon subunit-like protein